MPVADNYFLHYLLAGRYPSGRASGLPPYLAADGVRADDLTIADGAVTDWLRAQPDGSVHGFALSNIVEWLPPSEVDPLWSEVVRTAAPGARLCYRNLLGWTTVPARWQDRIVERPESQAMFDRDRSTIQRRFVLCDVRAADA
jgi:S-adenosylmethionine-diacylglycerol 3-amino-3-carboxypropyl transferase